LALEVFPGGDVKMQEAAAAHRQAECATVEQEFATATAAIKSLKVHQPSPLEVEQEACVKKCTEAKATADASIATAVAKLQEHKSTCAMAKKKVDASMATAVAFPDDAEEQNSGSDSDEELRNAVREANAQRNALIAASFGGIVEARRAAADAAKSKLEQSKKNLGET
jgi:hypothetical protein